MGTNRKARKYRPVALPPEREFERNMESLEDSSDETALVTLDLRRLIPAKQPGAGSEHQRAVVKAAEQIHARMMVMGREDTPWHELDLDTYDSYCIAAYTGLNAALQCGIAFVPEQEHSVA